MFPESLSFSYLKRRVSILNVLNDKGINTPFKKRGDQLFGPCPVHGGDNPNAFVISLSKNIWRCFTRCDAGGDVVEFVRRIDQKTYGQTAVYLASLAESQKMTFVSQPNIIKRPFRPFKRRLQLDPGYPWLRKKGIKPLTASRFEAGLYRGPGFLNGCIGVRLHDLHGRPIGYAGRRLDPNQAGQHGKWKFPVGLPKNEILYNYHRAGSNRPKGLVIVEGPWGVMRLAQLNIQAVALLGLSLSPIQGDILRKISRLIIMLDGDYAGRKAALRIQNSLAAYTQVQNITLPQGHDPDDLTDDELLAAIKHFHY